MDAADRAFNSAPSLPFPSDAVSEAGAAEGRHRLSGAFAIELRRLRPDPNQPRKNHNEEAQIEITASVKELGILQPISVRYVADEDVYQIISGERRFLAAQQLGLPEMPCIIHNPDDKQILVRQLVENWQRAELHPYDLADALVVLRDQLGYTQKQIADMTGKSESEISRTLVVLKLNPATQNEARRDTSGEVTRKHLVALAQLNAEEQTKAWRIVKAKHLTAEQTEQLVRQVKPATNEPRRGAPTVTKVRLKTSKAVVTLAFRKHDVTSQDMLTALEEAKTHVVAQEADAAAKT